MGDLVPAVDNLHVGEAVAGVQIGVEILRRVGVLREDQPFRTLQRLVSQTRFERLEFGVFLGGDRFNQLPDSLQKLDVVRDVPAQGIRVEVLCVVA